MQIICHRGLWNKIEDKNTKEAFENAFSNGYGVETDIREFNGELVISHDIANKESLKADEFFNIYSKYDKNLTLALNVKSDGVQKLIIQLLEKYQIRNYFLFDMSIPEQYVYIKNDFKIFTRHSDIEGECVLYSKANGVWLDAFEEEWIDEKIINYHLSNEKKICIVSPELHGREYLERWNLYKSVDKNLKSNEIILCTDKPIEARKFFYE